MTEVVLLLSARELKGEREDLKRPVDEWEWRKEGGCPNLYRKIM